jgi:hypothetical protein
MKTPTGVGRKLSEKSIELNFCQQMSAQMGGPAWWFGTTQKQEKDAGWDVSTRSAGAWVYFQLKASNHVLKQSGERQFKGHHGQLVDLQHLASGPLEVLYVFPTIGNTAELVAAGYDLIPNLRFLDVHSLPKTIPPPTKADGHLRKDQQHYFRLSTDTTSVTIHSEPIHAGLLTSNGLGADLRGAASQRISDPGSRELAAERTREYLRSARGRVAVFLPAST